MTVKGQTAICPFHDDSHPSMHLYRDGFYCFTCGAGGDVVTFTARLFGLKNRQAAEKLNENFHLGLEFGKPVTLRQQRTWEIAERQRGEQARQLQFALTTLLTYRRVLWRSYKAGPEVAAYLIAHRQPSLFMEALKNLERVDFYLDEYNRDQTLFLTAYREVVERIGQRICQLADKGSAAGG